MSLYKIETFENKKSSRTTSLLQQCQSSDSENEQTSTYSQDQILSYASSDQSIKDLYDDVICNPHRDQHQRMIDTDPRPLSFWEGVRCVIGGVMIHMILGSQYIWGNIALYCLSYFATKNSVTSDSLDQLHLGLPIIVLTTTFVMPCGQWITGHRYFSRFDHRQRLISLLIIACTIGISAVLVSILVAQTFMQFTLIFGIGFGICNGLAYTIPLNICWQYFPEQKGLVSGFILCGFGIGSLMFNFLTTILVNPDNSTVNPKTGLYDQEVAKNVPKMLQILCICWISLAASGIGMLKNQQRKICQKKQQKDENKIQVSVVELLQDKKFVYLYLMNFCSVFYAFILISSFKIFAGKFIKDDLYLTTVGSIASVFGSIRIVWSLLLDNGYSYGKVYGTLIILQMFCSLQIYSAAETQNRGYFLFLVSLSMFCEGGHFVLLPSHCAQQFGENGLAVFSYLFSCFGLSSIIGSLVLKWLVSNSKHPFQTVFNLASVLQLISLILLIRYTQITKTKIKLEQ